MKNKVKDRISVYSRTLETDKLEQAELKVIEDSYCPNGHSLISDDVVFFDHSSIHLKARHKKNVSDLFVSPVVGDKCKVSFDTKLENDVVYELICPTCKVTLPIASPCTCGGQLVALYLDKGLKLSRSVTVCSKFGCPNSEVKGIDKLKSMHF